MKLQFLGNSKDALKWDYLDFLAKKMDAGFLTIVPMRTPADGTGRGKTPPRWFPASNDILKFCRELREKQKLEMLDNLPGYTGGAYKVQLHKPENRFYHSARDRYFSDIKSEQKQILFLDPDSGFQPALFIHSGHVKYTDLETIWPQVPEDAVVVVFQHAKRTKGRSFPERYEGIRGRLCRLLSLDPLYSTALYWPDRLMFVAIGKSRAQIEKVRDANHEYQKSNRRVQFIEEIGERGTDENDSRITASRIKLEDGTKVSLAELKRGYLRRRDYNAKAKKLIKLNDDLKQVHNTYDERLDLLQKQTDQFFEFLFRLCDEESLSDSVIKELRALINSVKKYRQKSAEIRRRGMRRWAKP